MTLPGPRRVPVRVAAAVLSAAIALLAFTAVGGRRAPAPAAPRLPQCAYLDDLADPISVPVPTTGAGSDHVWTAPLPCQRPAPVPLPSEAV